MDEGEKHPVEVRRTKGNWLPLFVPRSSFLIAVLLVACSAITSTTFGYDGSMLNGLNILPSYTGYFDLNPATTGLQTAAVWIGGFLAVTFGKVTDYFGRRPALFIAAAVTIIGIVLQTAAQDIAMFVVARILVGYGTSASGVAGPVYLAETLPFKWRAWGLGVFNDCYYVGALIAAGVTYGTAKLHSTWAWRIPSAVQGVFSIMCIVILPFVPESPRWLYYQGFPEEARLVLAQTHSNGDLSAPIVAAQLQEIVDTLEHEKRVGKPLSIRECVKTPFARKRVSLAVSCALFSTMCGNVIASYYLGTQLTHAGVKNKTTQLEINIILNVWSLACALFGTWLCDIWGRKATALASTGALTVFLFLIGGLTKIYGHSHNTSGIYGTVALIFLFQGSYSVGWTPILYLYPPEVLNYAIRANGMGIFNAFLNGGGLLFTSVMPIALTNLGWKFYMINGSWDVLMFLAILFWWVETKGRSLEEIDAAIEGHKHSAAPDLQRVLEDPSQMETVESYGASSHEEEKNEPIYA